MADSMNDRVTVSVLVPVYNAEEYIEESIESIRCQTFGDLEIIAIDDGSEDRSYEILKRIKSTERRLRIVRQSHRGLVNALNLGIDLALGDWIARLDADDIMYSDRIESQLEYCRREGVQLCGGAADLFSKNRLTRRRLMYPESDRSIKIGLMFGCVLLHPTIFCRSDIMKVGYCDMFHGVCEDYDLWVRLALRGVKMGNIQKPVIKHRLHENQLSTCRREAVKAGRDSVRRYYISQLGKKRNINARDIAIFSDWLEGRSNGEPTNSKEVWDSVKRILCDVSYNEHNDARVVINYCKGALIFSSMNNIGYLIEYLKYCTKQQVLPSVLLLLAMFILRVLPFKKDSMLCRWLVRIARPGSANG